ncbi:acyl-CoA thioesterase domain-containing protein [Mycolicibacterium sp.]|uniref:acyl-CoA thioesterase n=1 Tax=Mycolicibacterium sp. TaxID=2320850 RepID=UPI0028AED66F|nr:acyl-CoA thioesterase domain-containing protein [Mycolicibacterium sp.]
MTGSALTRLLAVTPTGEDIFDGTPNGPTGKRAYGGHLAAQALTSACRTTTEDRVPTSLHVQFLRGGDAGEPVRYSVERTHDGRTTSSRRVLGRQGDRVRISATALFAVPADGPQHSDSTAAEDPEQLVRSGPIGPAPSLPLEEIDIRIRDEGQGPEFVRRLWWRVTADLPDEPTLHAAIAVYVTDVHGVDPVLAVHGASMTDRSHHAATTDSSAWFHRPIRADRWNLLESRSPAAARGRGVVTAGLYDARGMRLATLVHEGQAVTRTTAGGD